MLFDTIIPEGIKKAFMATPEGIKMH